MRRGDWGAAAGHWEEALALNPLNPSGWFALGYACLKGQDDSRAVQVGHPSPCTAAFVPMLLVQAAYSQ